MSFHQAYMNPMGLVVIRPPKLQSTIANENDLQCDYDRIQSRQGWLGYKGMLHCTNEDMGLEELDTSTTPITEIKHV